jgi:hypothetical protein
MSDPLGLALPPCKRGKGKTTGDTPGGGNDAGKVPGGNGSTSTSGADPRPVGNHDGVNVQVDHHQMKHQNGNLYNLPPYTGGKGSKFPGYVNEKWHENHLGPNVGKATKENPTVNRLDNKVHDTESAWKNKQEEVGEAKIAGTNKVHDLKQATKDFKKDPTPENQAKVDQLTKERDEAAQQYKKLQEEEASAKSEHDQALADRAGRDHNNAINDYKKTPGDDGITYDITTHWDADKGGWTSTYHANPATPSKLSGNEATKWWDDNYGKDLSKNDALKG